MSDLVQIARQRIDGAQRTHWEGCERDHRECLIQRMADEIERLRAQTRGDAAALRMIAEALGVPEDARRDGGIMRAIERLRAQITDAEVLATYGRDDGWREWANVGTWLYPGDRIVVLRREEER